MKKSKYLLEDKPKEQKAAAYDMDSNASALPPDFSISSNGKNSNQPIQAMFANSQMMGLDEKFPDVSLTPTPGGPVPVPYPNIGGGPGMIGKGNNTNGMTGLGTGMTGMMGGGYGMGMGMGTPNVLMPGMGMPGMGMPMGGGMGMGAKKKESSSFGGMASSLFSGIGGLVKGAGSLVKGVGDIAKGGVKTLGEATHSFSGKGPQFMKAIKFGKMMFKLQAKFKNITIMAVSAIGTPGCLDGPKLESNIKLAPSVAGMKGKDKIMRDAIAKGVSDNFDKWRSKVTVPGLPWYPAFAAWPGSMAPPTPNVPTPLISCPSSMIGEITVPSKIKDSIMGALPSDMKTPANEAFVQALAAQIATHFLIWLASQQVMMVMGKGPVPSYAPPSFAMPHVPAGPVIAGDVISTPGHLIA